MARGTGTLLDYDYRASFVAGRTPFTDRSDLQAGLDLGANLHRQLHGVEPIISMKRRRMLSRDAGGGRYFEPILEAAS